LYSRDPGTICNLDSISPQLGKSRLDTKGDILAPGDIMVVHNLLNFKTEMDDWNLISETLGVSAEGGLDFTWIDHDRLKPQKGTM
jgi:hypothetical protein